MQRRVALLIALGLSSIFCGSLGCGAPPPRIYSASRDLPDPATFRGDWLTLRKLGLRHMEQGYSLRRMKRKTYHFDNAMVAFRRARTMRETALAQAPDPMRDGIERDIDLLQLHLEACQRDRPMISGR